MSYALLRPALFALDAETAHSPHAAIRSRRSQRCGLVRAPRARDARAARAASWGSAFPTPSGSPRGSTRTASTSTRSPRSASASSRSAPSRRARSPAIRGRACSGSPQAERRHQPPGLQQRRRRPARRERPARAVARRARHQHRQELRHAARARRRRLPRVPAQGLCARELRDGQHLVAEHERACANSRAPIAARRAARGVSTTSAQRSRDRYGRRVPLALKIAPDLDAGADRRRSPSSCSANTASTRSSRPTRRSRATAWRRCRAATRPAA